MKVKSCPTHGLWQEKQPSMLAPALRWPLGWNEAYSHSPFRLASGYSVP